MLTRPFVSFLAPLALAGSQTSCGCDAVQCADVAATFWIRTANSADFGKDEYVFSLDVDGDKNVITCQFDGNGICSSSRIANSDVAEQYSNGVEILLSGTPRTITVDVSRNGSHVGLFTVTPSYGTWSPSNACEEQSCRTVSIPPVLIEA
jgi:hypothetical protein